MEARVHVGAAIPLPTGSMDGSDCLGRPAVAGAHRHLGMAGHSASALDLFRAHGFSSTRTFAKTKFRGRPARTRGSPHGPRRPSLCCDSLSDLLSHLHADQCRPYPRRRRTLFCHCAADGCYLRRLDDQCRFTSWGSRGNSDYWIIAFGTCKFPSPARGTLICAVVPVPLLSQRCSSWGAKGQPQSPRCRAAIWATPVLSRAYSNRQNH